MKNRQSLTDLRRLARETSKMLDHYADHPEQAPVSLVKWTRWRTEFGPPCPWRYFPEPVALHRETEQAYRIVIPGTPWHIKPTPEACRAAAVALRRNPNTIGKEKEVRSSCQVEDTVLEARRLYGDDAATVLRRQLDTIDPDDYHEPAVRLWWTALSQIEMEDDHCAFE